MDEKATLPESFYLAIEHELGQLKNGIREYDLIQILKEQGYFDFLGDSPYDAHQIFQAHFMLYHALYKLRDRMLQQQQSDIEISALHISLRPYASGDNSLSQDDKLRRYYLDLANLTDTSEEDVLELIGSFWSRLGRIDGREDALATLGLEDPVDNATIRKTYRRLAMEHHPDRGGDNETFQHISAAASLLLKPL